MGYDIYACFDEQYMEIPPHQTVMIPTGIASACSKRYGFILKERGSTGTKGIGQRCGVIDSGYRGEWFVPLTNTTDKTICITKARPIYPNNDTHIYYPYYKAIAQAIIVRVPKSKVRVISLDQLKSKQSHRMNGRLGSSGK